MKMPIALGLLTLLLSCAYPTKIQLVGQFKADEIPRLPTLPRYYKTEWVANWVNIFKNGVNVFVISSSKNIGPIVEKHGMIFIYYLLYVCGTSGEDNLLYIGPVFPASLKDQKIVGVIDDNEMNYYVIYLPIGHRGEFFGPNHQKEIEKALKQYGACISIGAGAMHGPYLTSNVIEIGK